MQLVVLKWLLVFHESGPIVLCENCKGVCIETCGAIKYMIKLMQRLRYTLMSFKVHVSVRIKKLFGIHLQTQDSKSNSIVKTRSLQVSMNSLVHSL